MPDSCCSAWWCTEIQGECERVRVCRTKKPGESDEECQAKVNEQAEQLKASTWPENCSPC